MRHYYSFTALCLIIKDGNTRHCDTNMQETSNEWKLQSFAKMRAFFCLVLPTFHCTILRVCNKDLIALLDVSVLLTHLLSFFCLPSLFVCLFVFLRRHHLWNGRFTDDTHNNWPLICAGATWSISRFKSQRICITTHLSVAYLYTQLGCTRLCVCIFSRYQISKAIWAASS